MNSDALFKALGTDLDRLISFTAQNNQLMWKAEAFRYTMAYKYGVGRTPRAALSNLYTEIHAKQRNRIPQRPAQN